MNNTATLIELGFSRFPDWDMPESEQEAYRLDKDGKTFRAHVVTCNPPVYVIIGEVINDKGIVKCWKDCVSKDSVKRFI